MTNPMSAASAPTSALLGYVKVQTNDIERWRTFAFDVLGFAQGSGPDPDALYLRVDERAARIVVVPGETDEVVTVGWEVRDHAALVRVRRPSSAPASRSSALTRGGGRAPRRGGHHLPGSGRHHARGLPRRGPRPQPGRHPVRRQVRHRRTGSRPRRAAHDGSERHVRLLHRRPRLPAARRLPDPGTAGVRSAAGALPGCQPASPQPGAVPGPARRSPRPGAHHGRGRPRSTPSARRSTA